jgi:hypothetical protein
METALLILLPILTAACTVASFLIARASEAKKKGENSGALQKDIEYIKQSLQSLIAEQKLISDKMDGYLERLIIAEQSAKAAHKRLDDLTKQQN